MSSNQHPYIVTAMYKFVALPDYTKIQKPLKQFCADQDIFGTILLAEEGLNGTVAGSEEAITNLHNYLRTDELFAGRLIDLKTKESWAETKPFARLKIRLKKEIVALGDPDVDPTKQVGNYVKPEQWNELLADPELINIDTRNDYEVEIGTFKGALNPKTQTFRQFKDYVRKNLDPKKHKKVAMFCTGGIRCEKASSFMLKEGFEQVYHLEGGILKYLEEVEQPESLWDGDCFVFDERIAVTHGLELSQKKLCQGCNKPLKCEDLKRNKVVELVQQYCLNCAPIHQARIQEQQQDNTSSKAI